MLIASSLSWLYRRVLEQFLSVNISERNALIESYLIGNRLFKFLSVVLPTHRQYFSRDPKFEELRKRSESQLMELLEYMEELEIMIDEMKYNQYIYKDLTPSELNDIRNGNETSFITNDASCNDDRETHGQLLGGLTKNDGNHDEKSNDAFIDETNMKIPIQTNDRKGTLRQNQLLQVGAEEHSSQGDIDCGVFQGGNVKVAVGELEALHESEDKSKCTTNNFDSKHKLLKERVAAVVISRNNAELLRTSLPSIRSAKTRSMRSTSSSPASTDGKRLDVLPETTSTEVNPKMKEIIPGGDDSIGNKGRCEGILPRLDFSKATQIPEKQQPCAWDTKIQDSLPDDSFTSWDADFSNFHLFTPEINQFEFLDEKKTHIDLLLDNAVSTNGISKKESKLLPKVRDPPISNAHNIRAHTQYQAATFSSSFRHTDITMNMFEPETSPALSDCSSDVFYSLEDRGPFEISPVKTKIEERMELASVLKGDTPGRRSISLNTARYEDSSLVEAQSQRKRLHHFRGCVKYFL